MRRCSLEMLDTVFASIAKVMELYLPVCTDDGEAVFSQWKEGVKRSTALNTAKSPKELFFPQTEDMMAFKTEGKSIEVIDTREPEKDFVVFGIRPCDVKALEILDRVFLTEPRDSYYASKREKGIIVSLACSRPAETCFCNAFGIDPAGSCGDVTVWETDEWLYWQSNSEKGQWLLNSIETFTEECSEEAVNEQKAKTAEIMKKLPLAELDTQSFGGGKTDELFDRPEWESLSESCLGCG
ncbi:MAG: 4Fe-4S ferredoxin, partial [Oscillospiraceae bacterium]|nr:4Fe-4S ferredoxin [Oscillospiraceae bacterium]